MSTERELAEKFKEAIETKNIDIIYPHLVDGMTYEILPSTVGRKLGKGEWKGQMTAMFAVARFAKMEFTNVIEHPLFIAVQANITIDFPRGLFTQDILLLLKFTKEESNALKIVSIIEYVDSFKVKEMKEKLRESGQIPSTA